MHYGLLQDTPPGEWVPDVLEGFSRRTIHLGEDHEGPLSATLVRHDAADGVPVLYIHGWSDYFYNTELAQAAAECGYKFYALDLRKYGRSLREYQTPGYVDDLAVYDDDIGSALAIIKLAHPGYIPAIIAHSTGGLVAALWADRHPQQISTLVLNAPWLSLQGNTWLRSFANTVADPLWRSRPERRLLLPKVDFFYRSISATEHGEWVLHPLWRPRYAFDIRGGWLSAILDGHAQVRKGLTIDVPVFVMTSTASYFAPRYSVQMQRADSVIDVEDTVHQAVDLGETVMIHKVRDALHDVYASAQPIRQKAFDATFAWLDYFSR